MSSPTTGFGAAPGPKVVEIHDHPTDLKKLVVNNNEFWVSKGNKEVAEWFCKRNHKHGENPPCFTVKFDKKQGSPFKSALFTSGNNGHASSDEIVVQPGTTIYEYRVQAPGKDDLDPGGGVKK
jgi:hypothetical protein